LAFFWVILKECFYGSIPKVGDYVKKKEYLALLFDGFRYFILFYGSFFRQCVAYFLGSYSSFYLGKKLIYLGYERVE